MAYAAPHGSPIAALGRRPAVAASVGVLGALAIVAFGLFVGREIGRPFLYDEVNFTFGAEAVARTGIPFANAG